MTKIEWADKTWNPVTGCTKISEGCTHCYAERMSKRLAGRFGYPADDPFRVTLHEDKLDAPLSWKKPRTVFCVSMGDLFHKDVPGWYQATVFDIMARASQHTFLVLTKRPSEMRGFLEWYVDPVTSYRWPFPNVWLGVTVENQARADERIPLLLQCPAAVRYVSYEPALGAVSFKVPSLPDGSGSWRNSLTVDDPYTKEHHLDWIICGAETGPGARPMDPDWARSVRDQCKDASVPFFFKKMGQGQPIPSDLMIREWPTTDNGTLLLRATT